jgi:hypothetical protein
MEVDLELLERASANCAAAYRAWSEGTGRRTRLWDDLSCADLELPESLPPNSATLLRRPEPGAIPDVVKRTSEFFGARPGGGYELWSLWRLPEPVAGVVDVWTCPCMIREPGGEARPAPAELEIVEADDAGTVRDAEALIAEVFGSGAAPGSTLSVECLGDEFRVWVGRVGGRPVTTAMAAVSAGFVGIYAVATAESARGHGYGEAVTWAATLSRPELPATLQASELGRPVYERMGYRTVAEFTVWDLPRLA